MDKKCNLPEFFTKSIIESAAKKIDDDLMNCCSHEYERYMVGCKKCGFKGDF